MELSLLQTSDEVKTYQGALMINLLWNLTTSM